MLSWTDAEKLHQHEDKVLMLLTLIIGAFVGLVVVAFILLTENLALKMYPVDSAPWRRLLIPVLGSLIGGFLLTRYFPAARGSGIPQTKAALFLHNGYISFKTAAGKFFCSSLSLASGIALGREGPSVQVGAGIASALGRRLGLSPEKQKALIPIGASAALAAAFNTPIAAVLFSLEEVMGDMHAPVLGSIVLSSATSWIVMRTLLGNEPLFHVPSYQLVHPAEFLGYIVLGILGGLVSVAFVKLLLRLRKYFLSLPKKTTWWQPVAGGLLVGGLGWFVPEVLGVGYGQVGNALNGQLALKVMILLVVLKLIATATCYASGNAGGIFGPSLFIGAMLGGAFGSVAHSLFPDYTGGIGAYALVGMGTAFAGIIRVPLTSVIMIFEITRDYSIVVPLMISNLLAYIISYKLQPEPIYEALQHQEGIHLPSYVKQRIGLLLVQQAMRPPSNLVWTNQTPASIVLPKDPEENALPLMDQQGLVGMVFKAELEVLLQVKQENRPIGEIIPYQLPVPPLTSANFVHVHEDHPLDTVLKRMAETGLKVLPVVSRTNLRELKGLISLKDVLNAYGLGEGPLQSSPAVKRELRSPLPTLVWLSASLLVLLLLSGFFVYYYHSERQASATLAFNNGNALVAQGRNEEAIEQYRNALSISHTSEHRIALALTLEKVNRFNEAAIYLNELSRVDPNNAMVNLGLARYEANQGSAEKALTYYHRAIYGHWPKSVDLTPVQVRFELVDYLEGLKSNKQAVTELMALSAEVHGDSAVEKQIGTKLLALGAARESEEIFKDLLRKDSSDLESIAGMGFAQFALKDYPSAQATLRKAVEENGENEATRMRLQTCDQIMAMDPTLRSVPIKERLRRSNSLLKETLQAVQNCLNNPIGNSHGGIPPELLEQAQKMLSSHPSDRYVDMIDARLELVEQLYRNAKGICGTTQLSPEALNRLLAKLFP
jgi:chloride channel protein, CIC family